MASRLSELLDRIRPAGTPGAPSDVVSQRRQATADELADLASELACLDAEVDQVIAEARARAGDIRARAERRVEQIRADLPDRLAAAESDVLGLHDDAHDVDRASVEFDREIARIRSGAEQRLAELVDDAVAVVRNLLEPAGPTEAAR